MKISKLIARKIVFPLLTAVGADTFLYNKCAAGYFVLNYHGVIEKPDFRFNNRHLPADEFQKHLVYLKKHFDVIPLPDLFDRIRDHKPAKRKTIAITFDDGYLNNFAYALPLLRQHDVPATFFIITKGIADENYLVWPDLIDIHRFCHPGDMNIDGHLFKGPALFCEEKNMDITEFLKRAGHDKDRILATYFNDHDRYRKTVEQYPHLFKLADRGILEAYRHEALIEYGSHTHAHFNLEFLTDEQATDELLNSKQLLENAIGKPVVSIAYPDGSYHKMTRELSLKAGYKNILAVDYKLPDDRQNEAILNRFSISNSTNTASNMMRLAMSIKKYAH